MLIKILRPDMLVSSMRQFVIESVNDKFAAGDKFDLAEVFAESNSRAPIIFILSPGMFSLPFMITSLSYVLYIFPYPIETYALSNIVGTDPSGQLLRFAKEMRGSTLHVDMVSLGRGQGPKAEELIHKAQILKGRWVFLQNCHLAASFMPRLQVIQYHLCLGILFVDINTCLFLSSPRQLWMKSTNPILMWMTSFVYGLVLNPILPFPFQYYRKVLRCQVRPRY